MAQFSIVKLIPHIIKILTLMLGQAFYSFTDSDQLIAFTILSIFKFWNSNEGVALNENECEMKSRESFKLLKRFRKDSIERSKAWKLTSHSITYISSITVSLMIKSIIIIYKWKPSPLVLFNDLTWKIDMIYYTWITIVFIQTRLCWAWYYTMCVPR